MLYSTSSYGSLKRSLLAGAAVSMALPVCAAAQTPGNASAAIDEEDRRIDVMIVTASKREENLQDVPIAITAIGGDDLQRLGASDIADYVYKVPGLAFNRTDRSSNQLSIRGLTSFTRNPSEFPMVGAYVDDVPISETAIPDIGLVDLERIEVLRGPQGTLYGEGSMGGTIKYVTARPDTKEFGGFLTGEFSSVKDGGEGYKTTGAVNIPLVSDVAALRISGLYEDGAGFVDNAATGEEDADAFERYGVRASLLVNATDALTFNFSGAYQKFEGGIPPTVFPELVPGVTPPGLGVAGDDVSFRVAPSFSEDEVVILNGAIEYDFGFATLTSSTSYYDRTRDGSEDEILTARTVEAGTTPLTENLGLGPFVADQGVRTVFASGNEAFSQEVRFASNGDGPLQYTLGFYYREREVFFNNDTFSDDLADLNPILVNFGLSGNPDYDGFLQIARAAVDYTQWAVFGEVSYDLTDRLTLTGGLRYFDEDVEGDQSIEVPNFAAPGPTFLVPIAANFPALGTSEDDVLWKAGLSYKATDGVLIYVQAATGFRPGGVNPRANPTPGVDSPAFFGSDSVTSYELGVKSQLFDNILTLNLAGYYSELEDAQFEDSRDPAFPVVRNSGGAEILGFEAEALVAPTNNLLFGGNLSVLSSEFSENALPFDVGGGDIVFLIEDGQQLPIAREFTASAFVEWSYPVTSSFDLFTYADVSYADGAPVNTVREETGTGLNFNVLDSYTLVNAQIGLESERWRATFFVDNLTDEFVELGGTPAGGLARDLPRTYGVRLRASF